jgi:hypothetical protein
VRSAGVVVGRITSISLDPKTFQGVVTLDVDRRFQFPKDSSAKILTAGLLGDQYIGIEPGGDDKNLAAGDTIAQTQSAVVLENLIGQFLTGKAADAGAAADGGVEVSIARRLHGALAWRCMLAAGCATVPAGTAPAEPGRPLGSLEPQGLRLQRHHRRGRAEAGGQAYRDVVPQLVRTGVSNFFGNIGDVWSTANHFLQGKVSARRWVWTSAARTLGRPSAPGGWAPGPTWCCRLSVLRACAMRQRCRSTAGPPVPH